MADNILWQSAPDSDRHEWRVETEEEWGGYDGLIIVNYFPCVEDRVAIPREHVVAIAQAMLAWANAKDVTPCKPPLSLLGVLQLDEARASVALDHDEEHGTRSATDP